MQAAAIEGNNCPVVGIIFRIPGGPCTVFGWRLWHGVSPVRPSELRPHHLLDCLNFAYRPSGRPANPGNDSKYGTPASTRGTVPVRSPPSLKKKDGGVHPIVQACGKMPVGDFPGPERDRLPRPLCCKRHSRRGAKWWRWGHRRRRTPCTGARAASASGHFFL